MRCPKCGYISFDHLETCKKCHKYLGDALAGINGTTYDTAPPMFLTITSMDQNAARQAGEKTGDKEAAPVFDDEKVFALEESNDLDFDLGQDFDLSEQRNEIEFASSESDLVLNLDDIADSSPRNEFTLDLDGQSETAQPPMPSLDFGDLDISDLAPPAKESAEPIRFEGLKEQPSLSDLEPEAAPSSLPPPPPEPAGKKTGLEDLNFSGLDLDTPAKAATGRAAGKPFLPSVKTGTALDKFDIDLGELFTDNKK